jgi:hypothetical protein
VPAIAEKKSTTAKAASKNQSIHKERSA